eukprot:2504445-Amphidinium_carterae.1
MVHHVVLVELGQGPDGSGNDACWDAHFTWERCCRDALKAVREGIPKEASEVLLPISIKGRVWGLCFALLALVLCACMILLSKVAQ